MSNPRYDSEGNLIRRTTIDIEDMIDNQVRYEEAARILADARAQIEREVAAGNPERCVKTAAYQRISQLIVMDALIAFGAADRDLHFRESWDFTMPPREALTVPRDYITNFKGYSEIYPIPGNQVSAHSPIMCTCSAFVAAITFSNYRHPMLSFEPPRLQNWAQILDVASSLYEQIAYRQEKAGFTSIEEIDKLISNGQGVFEESLRRMAMQRDRTIIGGPVGRMAPCTLTEATGHRSLLSVIAEIVADNADVPVTGVITSGAISFCVYYFNNIFAIVDTHTHLHLGPGMTKCVITTAEGAGYHLTLHMQEMGIAHMGEFYSAAFYTGLVLEGA